jgi:orotidine-5'-phosphate decarboxylase
MLDLKLHDIPETVERAVGQAGDLGVKFLTLHVQQRDTMRRAVKMAEKTGLQLLAVTVLTSMTEADLMDLMQPDMADPTFFDPAKRALRMAMFAADQGVTGFVCSPQEAKALRTALPKSVIVTPGIRPAGADAGDQKRVGTPSQAVADGADYLVVGRSIREAPDPVAAAASFADEVSRS